MDEASAPWPVNSRHGAGSFWAAVHGQAGQPYVWGSTGPGDLTVRQVSTYVPVSRTLLEDVAVDLPGALRELMRQDFIQRRAMRRMKVADPEGYERLQHLLRLAEAARLDREDREREARRCPTCGCDPLEHEDSADRWE